MYKRGSKGRSAHACIHDTILTSGISDNRFVGNHLYSRNFNILHPKNKQNTYRGDYNHVQGRLCKDQTVRFTAKITKYRLIIHS